VVDQKWGVAVLGAGRICARHIRAIRVTGELDVAWLVSRTAERACAVAGEHGIARHGADPYEALADPAVRAVVVAYPTQEHARLTLAALVAGKDVVCEKPLSWTAAEAREVLAAARRYGRRLAVCHIRRYWAPCARLKELAAGLGTIRQVSWSYRVRQRWPADWRTAPPGGYLLDAHVHDADMLHWLLGRSPSRVFAWGHNRADGAGLLHFTTADGAAAWFDWDGNVAGREYPQGAEHRAEVLGEVGWVRLAIVNQDVVIEHFREGMERPLQEGGLIGEAIAQSWPAMWGAFARYLLHGEQPAVSAAEGAFAVEMVLSAVQSMERGDSVPLQVEGAARDAAE
jgi:predicted dehydrogenase